MDKIALISRLITICNKTVYQLQPINVSQNFIKLKYEQRV